MKKKFFHKDKPVVFSGIQPSGSLTIGNYIGAIREWVRIQDQYNCIYCIADQHSITKFDKKKLSLGKNILDTLAIYIACGIDPKKSIVFVQSKVPQHFQLNWVLSCYTPLGELKRMTQFKENFSIYGNRMNIGILNYPVLMAADILLYGASLIPVGIDQMQHIEICRRIANRFNKIHGNVFKIPKAIISKFKVMGIKNPEKKMSKSDHDSNNVIKILDNPELIMKKIRLASTDSENPPKISFDMNRKSGISNLINIFSSLTELPILEIEKRFFGKNYLYFKKCVCKVLIQKLNGIQEKFFYVRKKEKFLERILQEGSERAKLIAKENMEKVFSSIGI
ncbi:tryptophan--tRNA ligase [Candidatus Riesia pediculicola]|uniref:tryptophan--tRNA ligase n=1 Tax=Candidatus Riesia pediculicola TaxID=401619 RepID=UPI0009C2E5E7|nr:tryptophan--tRNA ligase [Candidatus Riesia pediculicola]ARC54503.1 tryptophan--tRNA ligase [Candidatus Riesia pediculicola]